MILAPRGKQSRQSNRCDSIIVSGNERRTQIRVDADLAIEACVPINLTQLNVTRRQAYSHKWGFRAQSAIDLDANVYIGDCRVAWRRYVFWIVCLSFASTRDNQSLNEFIRS